MASTIFHECSSNANTSETHFERLLEFLTFKEILSSIVLVSGWHYNGVVNAFRKKRLIRRFIENQISGSITSRLQFVEYYERQTTSPYAVVRGFYDDVGYIQQYIFRNRHEKIMEVCSRWKAWCRITNWWDFQEYNHIEYTKLPFDLVVLAAFENAEILIHWMRFIMNKTGFRLHQLCLNRPPTKAFSGSALKRLEEVMVNSYCK